MFSKLLGKKNENSTDKFHNDIIEKISKMNLTEMRSYSKDKIKDFPICEFGLEEILKKLTLKNEKTLKYYLSSNDMDSKFKKGFDLVLSILQDKKITISIIEESKIFVDIYQELILEYDKNNKDIYHSRFNKSLHNASNNFDLKTDVINDIEIRSMVKKESFIILN